MNHTVKNVLEIISIVLFAIVLRWLLIGDWINKLSLENTFSIREIIHLIVTCTILYLFYTFLVILKQSKLNLKMLNKYLLATFIVILIGTGFNILLLKHAHSVISMLVYPLSLLWILVLIFRKERSVDYSSSWLFAFGIIIIAVYLISLELNSLITATQTFYLFSKQQWISIALMIPQLYYLGVIGLSILLFSKYNSKNIDTISEFSSNMVWSLVQMVGFLTFSVVYQFNDINIWKLSVCIIPILVIEIYLFNQFSDNQCHLSINWLYTLWAILLFLILLYFKWSSLF